MKGVILAGGTAKRLRPLTLVTNKHLLPVGKEPMLFHVAHKLNGAGIDEIMVITGKDHMSDIIRLLGSGKEFGCHFTYRVQEEAGGVAQALGLCKAFVGEDQVVVLLGDNVFEDPLGPMIREYWQAESAARVFLAEVEHPQRFGVPVIENGKISQIREKPNQPPCNLAVTGIYMYDASVFKIIERLKPSKRGELEITDVNNAFLQRGQLSYGELKGWWTDAGTFDSLHVANTLARMRPAKF
ncbi:MAG: spore coat protein [Planctomycetota bacterium]|nr:MAG: spore coat protein [Planctomycetota bacterium]